MQNPTTYSESVIYLITNKLNGKIYVGKTICFKNRYKHHKYNHKRFINTYLSRAFNKYGFENFEFSILENTPVEHLLKREVFWIKKLQSNVKGVGYNLRVDNSDNSGFKHSEKTKQLISEKLKGRKPWHTGKTNVAQLRHTKEWKLSHSKKVAGGLNPNAKVIGQFSLDNKLIEIFPSCREAADRLGCNPKSLSAVALGKEGKMTCKGFKWKYIAPNNSDVISASCELLGSPSRGNSKGNQQPSSEIREGSTTIPEMEVQFK